MNAYPQLVGLARKVSNPLLVKNTKQNTFLFGVLRHLRMLYYTPSAFILKSKVIPYCSLEGG